MNSLSIFDFCINALETKCKFSQDKLREQTFRFEQLFSELFKLIELHSTKVHQNAAIVFRTKKVQFKNYVLNVTTAEKNTNPPTVDQLMKDFLNLFLDMAFKCIHVYDIQTLCDGLATQAARFVSEYEYLDSIEAYYDFDDAFYYSSDRPPINFMHIIDTCANFSNGRPEYLSRTMAHDNIVNVVDFDGKQLKSDLHLKRVQGHRQDYDQHIFDKGLNKKRREHGFRLKERKSKKRLDYSV